jgi:hypothetical protein
MVVLCCDLDERKLRPVSIPKTMSVQRLKTLNELGAGHLETITHAWNPKLANRNIRQRFEKGASLWVVESEGRLAGYGWTLQGQTIGDYYFPLGPDDIQFFDFYVFPNFRGRALHWLLTAYILRTLASEGGARAFADTGEWNQAQLSSFKMTPFRRIGLVKTYKVFGRLFTRWVADQPADQSLRGPARPHRAAKTLRPND